MSRRSVAAAEADPILEPCADPGPAEAFAARRARLHEKMLDAGWSLDDIAAVESMMLAAHLSATYLAAGYSPDEVETIIGLCR